MDTFTNKRSAYIPTAKSAPKSLVTTFANYGLERTNFRSFVPHGKTPSDFKSSMGVSSRGIPAGALEAQITRERTNYWTQEGVKTGPMYRSLPMPSSASPMAQPLFQSSSRKTFDALGPKPVYRGMRGISIEQKPVYRGMNMQQALPAGFGNHNSGLAGVVDRMGFKSPYSIPASKPMPERMFGIGQDEIVIPSLPSPPYRLERHSSFYSMEKKDSLKSSIEKVLAKHGADFEFDMKQCKWKVFAYNGEYCTSVVVNIFKMQPDSKPDCGARFAVEIQRRKGDAFAFFRWFRPLYNEWVGAGFVCSKGGCVETATKQIPVTPAMYSQIAPPMQINELAPLMHMASNGEYDGVQAEAMRELSKLSANDENLKHFASADGFLPALKTMMLDSNNCNIHRCVATVIANMAQACPSKVVEAGCDDAICNFLDEIDRGVEQRKSQRESVRALAALMKSSCWADSTKTKPKLEMASRVLNNMLRNSPCSRMQAMCRKALARSA